MAVLPAPAQALLGTDAVAHVWTCNPDGTPQVSVVWVILQDDEILFGANGDAVKCRNLRANPRIILSIEDDERNSRGFQRHLVVHGRATVEDGPNPALMDRLAHKYTGLRRHPLALRDAPGAVVVRVSVERISGVGPWVEEAIHSVGA
jgi:PPOX class probable F420-dependent enzyme